MDPKNKVEDGRLVRPKAPAQEKDRPKRKPPTDAYLGGDYGVLERRAYQRGHAEGLQLNKERIEQLEASHVELRVRVEALERKFGAETQKHFLQRVWEILVRAR